MKHRLRGCIPPIVFAKFVAARVLGQTIDDGVMMSAKNLCTGFVYTRDSWEAYWEGTLKRAYGNIGSVTTQSVSWMGVYGVTDRLNVIAMLPYVWTDASQRLLSSMDGLQDVSVAVKYEALRTPFTGAGALSAFAVVAAG